MESKIKYLMPIILTVLFLSLVGTGFAQGQETITAAVDRTALSTGEMLTLTVTLLNADVLNIPKPALPSLQGFNVAGSSTSSQISIINASVSSQVVYVYHLQPYQTGNLVIDPIHVTLNGQIFSTEPITIQVTPGTGSAQASSPVQPGVIPAAAGEPAPPATDLTGLDLFVEAAVDNPTPYVGQQVVHTFRFYQAVNLRGQPQYEAPSFKGFWHEHQPDQNEYRVQAAGRTYQVTEVRTILFPSAAGPASIDPATLTTPGSFFRSGRNLHTSPVALDVQPLPPNAPEGFSGAVGQFTLTSAVDTTQGKVNEPLTWQVALSGWGNISGAPDPTWPEMPGWRDFESQATVQTEVRDGQAAGSRAYERLLVPSAAGEFTVPLMEYAYFDPLAGTYQNISTEPIPVAIAPGAAEAPPVVPLTSTKEAVEQIATDIRHLKPVPPQLRASDRPVTEQSIYWVAWGFPLVGAVGYFVWQRRQRYWENNLGLVRSSQARRKAKKALSHARKQEQDSYSAAGQILITYLSDKLDRPVAGLTHQVLADLLTQEGVNTDLAERVEVCLVSSELGRFAPGADSPDHARSLLKEVGILISALEKAL